MGRRLYTKFKYVYNANKNITVLNILQYIFVNIYGQGFIFKQLVDKIVYNNALLPVG